MTSQNGNNNNNNNNSNSDQTVYFVIHQLLPTYSMYLDRTPYSEPIDSVNATVVGVYKTYDQAQAAAKEYFFETLGYEDTGESENGGYCFSDPDGHCGTWDEEVIVESQTLH